jgi:hypothetical protein
MVTLVVASAVVCGATSIDGVGSDDVFGGVCVVNGCDGFCN